MIVLEKVQSRTLQDIDDVEPLGPTDYGVLKEVGDVLRKYGLTQRFGVCLLHKHFDVSDDEELVEETDVESRVSTVSVKPAGAIAGSSIETMWRFGQDVQSVTKCVSRCHYDSGHRRRHHIEGH